jgi:hypothetical protein
MNRIFDFTHAIARRPGISDQGLRAGGGADPSLDDVDRTRWLSAALRDARLAVTESIRWKTIPTYLVEDPALLFTRAQWCPGAPSREAKGNSCEKNSPRGSRYCEQSEGYADGGDVLVMPDKAFIGSPPAPTGAVPKCYWPVRPTGDRSECGGNAERSAAPRPPAR